MMFLEFCEDAAKLGAARRVAAFVKLMAGPVQAAINTSRFEHRYSTGSVSDLSIDHDAS